MSTTEQLKIEAQIAYITEEMPTHGCKPSDFYIDGYVRAKSEIERRADCFHELLEALKAIVALEKTPDDVWDAVEVVMPKMCEIANAAIAKAEVQP